MPIRPELFSFWDAIALLFWGTVFLVVANYVAKKRYPTDPARKYLVPALALKLFGGVMVGVVYQYYYDDGDTNVYYRTGLNMVSYMADDFWEAIRLFSMSVPDFKDNPELLITAKRYGIYYVGRVNEMAIIRFIFPFIPLAFKTYYGTSLFISAFSMVGVWGIYRVFLSRYPKAHNALAWGILFLPSLFFWGSGILKDSICIGGLGIILYTIDKLNKGSLKDILNHIMLILVSLYSGWIIFSIKPYILLSLLGIISIWIGLDQKNRIKNKTIRAIVSPFILVVFVSMGAFAVTQLSADQQRYSLDNVLEQAVIIQDDLTRDYYYKGTESGGSRYDIGDFEPTPAGILSVVPICVFTAWFRPFLWEANSIVMLAAAIETIYIIYLFLLMFRDAGPIGFLRALYSDPLLLFCFLYAFFFGIMVGLTSGNFGNLTRYRIPMMPFLMAMIILVRQRAIEKREEKKTAITRSLPVKRKPAIT